MTGSSSRKQRRALLRKVGKANPTLKALVNCEVMATQQAVVMRFNVSTRAVSYSPEAARRLAGTLIEAADRVAAQIVPQSETRTLDEPKES